MSFAANHVPSIARRALICAGSLLIAGPAGCARWNSAALPPPTPPLIAMGPAAAQYNPPNVVPVNVPVALPNPVVVPVGDRDVAWDQIVDVVDDYFKIAREQRVTLTGEYLNEGQIETFPNTGATLLEPWREDSVGFYQRLESTLQSIRRRAYIRVMPDAGGYLVDVTVFKELEDVPRPQDATAGAAVFTVDNAIDRNTEQEPSIGRQIGDQPRPVANPVLTAGWIGIGRDPQLEQVMLARIQERLTQGPILMQPRPAAITPVQSVPVLGVPAPQQDVGLPPSNR